MRQLSHDQSEPTLHTLGSFRRAHRRAYYALLTRLERRIYSNPGVALAAVSARTAVQLNSYFHRDDVRVIPNGVDSVQFSPSNRLSRRPEARLRRKLQPDDFVLLLIGNDWDVKGLATVIRAMAIVPDLPLQLIVVGSDAPLPFEQLSKQLGVSSRCRWEQPSGDVLDCYAAADLYVSPTREDSFGLPVAEAMASGLPVITSTSVSYTHLDVYKRQDSGCSPLCGELCAPECPPISLPRSGLATSCNFPAWSPSLTVSMAPINHCFLRSMRTRRSSPF